MTVGGSEAIDLCLRALVNPGEEVLIPEPSFVCYTPLVELIGAVPVPIETKAENQFRLTKQDLLDKITDKTKVLVLPYPNNPTGGVMRREHLEEIAEVLRERDIVVMSDEIYAELTYNGKHTSIASIDGMKERTVVVNGFSKAYAMTGWRLGYAAGPAPILKQMTKIHQFAIMCAPTTSQYAAVEALRNGDESIERMANEYNMRRRLIVSEFNRLGLDTFEPEGAFTSSPASKALGCPLRNSVNACCFHKGGGCAGDCVRRERGRVYPRVLFLFCYSYFRGGGTDSPFPRYLIITWRRRLLYTQKAVFVIKGRKKMSLVSITHTAGYAPEQILSDVRTHLGRFRLTERIPADSRVLIKPNLLMKRRPEEFTTTHPTLVEAVIICLKEAGIKNITVADSPGGLYSAQLLKGIYDTCGISEVCRRQQVALNSLLIPGRSTGRKIIW